MRIAPRMLVLGGFAVVVVFFVVPWATLLARALFLSSSARCAAVAPRLVGKRVVLASILRDAAPVFPYWRESVLDFVDCALQGGVQAVAVSVWSNGNTDGVTTAELLQLERQLQSLAVALAGPDGGASGRLQWRIEADGYLPEQIAQADRITKLAHIRNLAVSQLAESGTGAAGVLEAADALVFVNDVIFKPDDVFRLLEDFVTAPTDDQQSQSPMIVCGLDFAYSFYDIWVARDLQGQRLSALFPYIAGPAEQRARALAGQPFEVAACWNGLLVLDARMFVQEGLQFRVADKQHPGGPECVPSSESLLICLDYWRSAASQGRSVLIDPAVKVFYLEIHYVLATLLHRPLEWTLWAVARLSDFLARLPAAELPDQQLPDTGDVRTLLTQMTCTQMPNWKFQRALAEAGWACVLGLCLLWLLRRLLLASRRISYHLLKEKVDDTRNAT